LRRARILPDRASLMRRAKLAMCRLHRMRPHLLGVASASGGSPPTWSVQGLGQTGRLQIDEPRFRVSRPCPSDPKTSGCPRSGRAGQTLPCTRLDGSASKTDVLRGTSGKEHAKVPRRRRRGSGRYLGRVLVRVVRQRLYFRHCVSILAMSVQPGSSGTRLT